ncbi:MAG: RAD55 family ATPase [Candidatus Nanoarchaeia archaeon]
MAKKDGIGRVPTNIKGFDKLAQGGFPETSTVLLAGSPGTGKTIFGLEYIYRGAKDFNQKGLYISFEQDNTSIKEQALQFGWDLEKYEKLGLIELLYIPTKDIDRLTADFIRARVLRNKVHRLVVDSLSTLAINAPIYAPLKDLAILDVMKNKKIFSPPILGNLVMRRFIYNFIDELRNVDHCTSLLISESSEKGEYLSRDTISEFVCDSVLHFKFESMGGDFSRSILIRKMRHTKNDEDIHPLEIGKTGIKVHTLK